MTEPADSDVRNVLILSCQWMGGYEMNFTGGIILCAAAVAMLFFGRGVTKGEGEVPRSQGKAVRVIDRRNKAT
jgi:hypothetical protein